jgi:protease IV
MKKLVLVFLLLFSIGLGAAIATAWILGGRGGRLTAGETVLYWQVDGPILELAPEDLPFVEDTIDSLAALYPAFRAARTDPGISGLVVYVRRAELGLARAQELRRQLLAFRDAGKSVDCYLEAAGEGSNGTGAYLLASACERIHLAPAADLNLLGLRADAMFFRGTLDKLKVEPEFSRVGEYKSAVETFTEIEHSAEAEEALNAVLDGLYGQLVQALSTGRGKSPAQVRRWIDGAPWSAAEALEQGMVDALSYPDQFEAALAERLGGEPRFLPIESYLPEPRLSRHRVAVVVAEGVIVRGVGGTDPWTQEIAVGSDDMADLLRALADDRGVKAVVLRIDSPGGSALASDLILREVERLREVKPVVVSMADSAASGGYYIAAKADKIVAEPATLTGSIGIFSGKFVTRRFEEEVLGLTHDVLQRGANAGIYSSLEGYSPEQRERVQRLLDRAYETFIGHVAEGRGMESEAVERIASGRVWTGSDARRIGLVDELGGLDRALELACEEAGIDDCAAVGVAFYPEPPGLFALFFEQRQPRLPASLARAVRALAGRPRGLLELPPEIAGLARPLGS